MKNVVSGLVGEALFHPSPSIDPRNIEAIDGYAELGGNLKKARDAFALAHAKLEELYNLRRQYAESTTDTEDKKLLRIASAAERVMADFSKAFDDARTVLLKEVDTLDRSLTAALEQQALGSLNAEIRAHVKSLSTEDRGRLISQATTGKNLKVLTSVLGAPGFLSGISDEEHAHYTRRYRESTAPDSVRRLAASRKAVELLESRGGIALKQVEEAMGGSFAQVKLLRDRDVKNEKAFTKILSQSDLDH
jgi:hypothetical protein